MTDPIRAALERLVEAADQFGPVGGADGKALAAEVQKARAALAQPAPPAEGEAAELVEWLHSRAADIEAEDYTTIYSPTPLIRAADLLEQRHPASVAVSERWPEFSDCDDAEHVWCWNWAIGTWKLSRIDQSLHSHWLPAHALPLPAGEVE